MQQETSCEYNKHDCGSHSLVLQCTRMKSEMKRAVNSLASSSAASGGKSFASLRTWPLLRLAWLTPGSRMTGFCAAAYLYMHHAQSTCEMAAVQCCMQGYCVVHHQTSERKNMRVDLCGSQHMDALSHAQIWRQHVHMQA